MSDEIKIPTGSKRTPHLRPGEQVFAARIDNKLTLLSPSRLKSNKRLREAARPVRVVDWPEVCGSRNYRLYISAGWVDDISPQASVATYDPFEDPNRKPMICFGGKD